MRRSPEARRIAILAGGGSLPGEIAESLIASGAHVHIIAIAGAAELPPLRCPVTLVDFAQIGKILRILKTEALSEMLIIGSVKRPDLGAIRPDAGFFLALLTIIRLVWAGGDDALLRGIIEFFERRGVTIVGPADVAPDLIIPRGAFGRCHVPAGQKTDIEKGFAVIKCLAPFDIGQAVVVTHGRIEAIEGAEGTDRMLQRVAAGRAAGVSGERAESGGILVKGPKPGQELRIDLPAIGPNTVLRAVEAGLDGIAVAAGYVLAAGHGALQALADERGLFVEGVPADISAPDRAGIPLSQRSLGRHRPSAKQQADCIKGGGVICALMQHGAAAGAVVVHRSHVLAVETGEGVHRTLARARELRQWGRRLRKRKAGVVVLKPGCDLTAALIGDVAAAGLAGIAVISRTVAGSVSQTAIDAANRQGLFIDTLIMEQGEQG